MTDAGIGIDIRIAADVWRNDAATVEETVRRAALAALAGMPGPLEVSILLTGDTEIAALNRQWRGKDGPTNVLSFPGDDAAHPPGAPRLLGDIAIAYETLDREARRDGIAFAHHLAHLVVHGILHLRGFDHQTDAEAADMEGRETTILAGLGIADPYGADPRGTGPGHEGAGVLARQNG